MIPIPFNESGRLQALSYYRIVDSSPEECFDLLTRLAQHHFQVPIVLISLLDESRQWFKSRQGFEAAETSREIAFCAYAILSDGVMVVEDATQDRRFFDSPLVTGSPGIRFYAGAPLITDKGFRLGTFCIIDREPKPDFPDSARAQLADFAALAMQHLELRRMRMGADPQDHGSEAPAPQFDVLASVAHEIKEPLGAIADMAKAMESEAFGPLGSDDYRRCAADIARSSTALSDFARKTLDAVRQTAGEIRLEDEEVSVTELLAGAVAAAQRQFPDRDLQIHLPADRGAPVVLADRTYLLQMVNNLLGNAIKYGTTEPPIDISWRTRSDGTFDLTIHDFGIGMTPDEIEIAMQLFGRIPQGTKRNIEGVGLGLPLVKRLIELHGGRLLVESVKGVGTAVTLRFPLHRVIREGTDTARGDDPDASAVLA